MDSSTPRYAFAGVYNATLAGALTLPTDADKSFHTLDPDGSDRTVTLPALAQSGKPLFFRNTGSAGKLNLTEHADDGGSVVQALDPGECGAIYPDGTTAWRVVLLSELELTALILDTLTVDAIAGGDSSLAITGLAVTGGTGGAVPITGGATTTSGVGGAASLTGGAGSGADAGGAASVTGGLGGATNAVGGAASVTAGAGQGTGNGAVASVTGGASGAGATGTGGVGKVVGGASAATNGAGGAAQVTGGAGAGSGNGGAVTATGGTAGATGTGGAANVAGGIGGATSGVGGAATLTGGAGTNGNSAGGAATVTGGAGQGTASGGVASLVGGASGAGATGNGANAAVTGGAAASTNGGGGSVVLTPGAKAGSGIDGGIQLRGKVFRAQSAPGAGSDQNEVLTAAQLINGIYVHTIAQARTLTTPTGAQISAGCPADLAVGDSFDFSLITVGTGSDDICTLTAGDGNVTFIGPVTVGPDIHATEGLNAYGTWRFRNTGADTWVGYRIG
ncbi:MAG: hypothetical protein M5U26_03565 [Planctomycetota bacterium]|nr:hypothetical protein [Planctomycetota bacterium]